MGLAGDTVSDFAELQKGWISQQDVWLDDLRVESEAFPVYVCV